MTKTDSNSECTKPSCFMEFYKLTLGGHEKLFRSKINALNHLASCIDSYKYGPESDRGTVVLTATITRHQLTFLD